MNRDKELYRELRSLSWHDLWTHEVPRFNAADAKTRFQRVAVIRAVAVVFAESGAEADLTAVKNWLRSLLSDPEEKIRRYAIAALPKLPREADDEQQLLALTNKSNSTRELKHLASALGKIGGAETLQQSESLPLQTIQRVKAGLTRSEKPSTIKFDSPLANPRNIEILLHCRAGLEKILNDEVTEFLRDHKQFKLRETKAALVILIASAPFALSELLKLRCFDSLGFSLGLTKDKTFAAIADLASSPIAQHILKTFTDGPIRYRLDFSNAGHQRAAVRELATLIYKKSPGLLNGGGDTPWKFEIHSTNRAHRIELVPKIIHDPRFAYRRRDIPAASHPPLAACMARLSLRSSSAWEGERLREPSPSASSNFPTTSKCKSSSPTSASHVNPHRNRRAEILTCRVPIAAGKTAPQEIVWDPFCGSGLELIERSLLGGVKKIIGTDLSPEALQIAQENFAAANLTDIQSEFVVSDFRNFDPGPLSVIITNPPLGRRVPIPNLPLLIADLFEAASRHLVPGGQLIFVNPVNIAPRSPALQRAFSRLVDFGGFHCLLEKYILTDRKPAPSH